MRNNWIMSYKSTEHLLNSGYRKLSGLTKNGEEVYKHIQPTGASFAYVKGDKVVAGVERFVHPKCGESGFVKVSAKGQPLKICSFLNRGKKDGVDAIVRDIPNGTLRSTTTYPNSKVVVHIDTTV